MNLLTTCVFLGAFLAARAQDPTTVCYPPTFQTAYYNVITEDKGTISVDFTKQKFAEVSSVTGNKFIHDFSNLKSFAITGEGNFTTCRSFKLQQSQIMTRCLPPYSKLVSAGSGYFHHINGIKMLVQTWDTDTDTDVVFRVVFSFVSGQPYVPVMSQEYGYHGTTNLYMYLNPAPAISNQNVFTIPEACTTHDIKIAPIVG